MSLTIGDKQIDSNKHIHHGSRVVSHMRGHYHFGSNTSGSWLCLVVCILVSYALFAVYTFTEKSTRKIEVPLTFLLPYGAEISSSSTEFVTVEIYGLKEEIYKVDEQDLMAYVHVSSHQQLSERGSYPIFLKRKERLAGLRFLAFNVTPTRVRLVYNEQPTKKLSKTFFSEYNFFRNYKFRDMTLK